MKKKYIIAILLVLMFACAALAACIQNNPDGENDTYTVTFAGEGVSISPQKVIKGEKAIEPKAPQRSGFAFEYWYESDPDVKFDFNTAINKDITLNALWKEDYGPVDPAVIRGAGTKEDPYLIQCAQHLEIMSDKVKAGDEAYSDGYFKLASDVDLTGFSLSPIGTEEHPFCGNFDGNSRKISNLTVSASIRSDGNKYFGLFGLIREANVSNLTLENIDFDIESVKDGSSLNVLIGGLVASAEISNFANVSVSGSITTFLMADNNAFIGALCGYLYNSSNDQAYITYVENCFADIQMDIDEKGGEKGSLQNGIVGGLIGFLYNSNCTAAVINSAVSGKVYGGKYCGGIVAYVNGLTSVMDCFNTADVEATSTELTYAGGIVGIAFGDNLIMDCVSTGTVKGLKAEPNSYGYKSYAGGIVGYVQKEDYDEYYTAGSDAVNCYYVTDAVGADNITTLGSNQYAAGYFKSLDNIAELTDWNRACWTSADGVIRPSGKTAKDAAAKYVLTLKDGNSGKTVDKATDSATTYSILGAIDELTSKDGKVFWDWEFAGGVRYKFYVPVIKNLTLTASWFDVSDYVGAYKGTSSYTGKEVGTIILNGDGTLQWINSGVNNGSYKFDGEHVILNIHLGEISGSLGGDNLVFDNTEGSATVTYSFTKYNPTIIGEFISDSGNILTFSSDSAISYENEFVDRGAYVDGTYKLNNATTLVPDFGKKLTGYLTPTNIVINDENSITFNFVKDGQAQSEVFRKLGVVDYSDEGFVDEYYYAWASSFTSVDVRRLVLKSDGSAEVISTYSTNTGRYYYIQSTQTLKVILNGYVSNLKFDAERHIVYGQLQGGYNLYRPIVFTSTQLGELNVYTNYESSNKDSDFDYVFLYATASGANYAFVDDVFDLSYSVSDEIGEGKDVTVNGVKYRIFGHQLKAVGAEEGSYTLDGATVTLDGISSAVISGGIFAGKYYYAAFKDKTVTIVLDTNLIVFNYESAQGNGNVIQTAALDGLQGVWYSAGTGENANNPYYYKLVLDGMGHATLFYTNEGSYKLNWGQWGDYKKTSYGASANFNAYHKDYKFTFYYDRTMAYYQYLNNGRTEEGAYVVKGYDGPATPPKFDENKAGSYSGESGGEQVILNLRKDLSGTLDGNPISNVVFDGGNLISFTCLKVDYTLTFKQGGATLDSSKGTVELTYNGAITEVIPSGLCGVWKGTFEGYGASDNQDRGFLIEKDGTVYYYSNVSTDEKTQVSKVEYDSSTYTLTFTDNGGFNWTLVYDVENNKFQAEGRNEENITLRATLTKQA